MQFHSSACGYSIFPAHLLKRHPLPSVYSSRLCQRSFGYRCMGILLGSVCSRGLSVFMFLSCCFNYNSYVVYFKVWQCNASCFVLFAQDHVGYLGSLQFPTNFRKVSFQFWESVTEIFIEIALNLLITLVSIHILTILIVPIDEHRMSFHLISGCPHQFFYQ